jgi:hypothetical protein
MIYTGAIAMSPLTPAQRTLNLLAIQKPEITARLIRQVSGVEAVIVLDLEDSLWDVTDPARSAALKASARQDLLELTRIHPEIFLQNKIGARINKTATPEFTADLAVLSVIAQTLPLSILVPTKVESARELHQCQQALDNYGVNCEAIAPIVETPEGVANLPEIASTAAQSGIPAIVFGHYDYSLSAGHWPFLEFDETGYWEIAGRFIDQVERTGLGYIQAPLFSMYDDKLFLGVLGQMNKHCRNPFGMLTFGPRQTKLCADLVAARIQADPVYLRETEECTEPERNRLAREVQQIYESHRKEGKSFAVDPRTGRFIAPHQYAAALDCLRGAHA